VSGEKIYIATKIFAYISPICHDPPLVRFTSHFVWGVM